MNGFSGLAVLGLSIALSGCAVFSDYSGSNPGPHSELVKVVGVETPSRVTVRGDGYRNYYVDLAYIKPSTVSCEQGACSAIKDSMVGERFWVQHEYDRAGLYFYSFWPAGETKPPQPINIDLIMYGGYSRMAEYMALPNGKSELVARATEIGAANEKLEARVKGLKRWQRAIIGKEGK